MMKTISITEDIIRHFEIKLTEEEKSSATKEKYLRDIRAFAGYCGESMVDKETVIGF